MGRIILCLLLAPSLGAAPVGVKSSRAVHTVEKRAGLRLQGGQLKAKRLSGLRKTVQQQGRVAPRTPKGLQRCTELLVPESDLPSSVGEAIRYVVDVNGIGVGTVDFKIERQGDFGGKRVTEYRTQFNLDSLISILLSAKGRAASLVPSTGVPVRSMSRLTNAKGKFDEDTIYVGDSSRVESKRSKNGKTKEAKRTFPYPVRDFLSGFYLLRSLPANMNGCAVVYANHRAYTVWLKADGEEVIKTPVGMQSANRYRVRYGSERSKRVLEGKIWLAKDETRLPTKLP